MRVSPDLGSTNCGAEYFKETAVGAGFVGVGLGVSVTGRRVFVGVGSGVLVGAGVSVGAAVLVGAAVGVGGNGVGLGAAVLVGATVTTTGADVASAVGAGVGVSAQPITATATKSTITQCLILFPQLRVIGI